MAAVQRSNALSHSLTIMPLICSDGTLCTPLYVVLQEKQGQFGARVERSMFSHSLIYVAASTSGKMTTSHSLQFYEKVVQPNILDGGVLLLDSWGGQRADLFEENEIIIKTIPKNTTGMVQPCDVYFFRYV